MGRYKTKTTKADLVAQKPKAPAKKKVAKKKAKK
jgi:hypothetical protein